MNLLFESSKHPKLFLKLGAHWCKPCLAIAPEFEEASHKYGYKCSFMTVDIDTPEGEAIADELEIESIPAFIIFDKSSKSILAQWAGPNRTEFKTKVRLFLG